MFIKYSDKTKNNCLFFHKWKTLKYNGYTKYELCKKCGLKRITQPGGIYQPIDIGFLKVVK
jgi:hypothetical protein